MCVRGLVVSELYQKIASEDQGTPELAAQHAGSAVPSSVLRVRSDAGSADFAVKCERVSLLRPGSDAVYRSEHSNTEVGQGDIGGPSSC